MTATIIALAGLLLLFVWLLGGRDDRHEPTARRQADDAVDYAELEAAERDVQEAPDADGVRDWGPGAQKPPLG